MDSTLYLASRSPRRRELLAQAGIRFQVFVPKEDEAAAPRTRGRVTAGAIVKMISAAKADAAVREIQASGVTRALVLSADTLVFLRDKVLGKPLNEADARKMLKALSGKWHEVVTGVTVLRVMEGRVKRSSVEVHTKVKFFRLKPDWIDWYIKTGEPFDKAGAYGIQGPGASLIEEIRGSYTNVVGLPVGQTLALLDKMSQPARLERGPTETGVKP